ncbi:uncharacterized protein LDX57_011621 [Aspergillus melleus]|uniref:uncharacterized protein n=1 Tax=Aspergillus melleus TaxID=138277 RepID=UPI001E8DF9D1|nr:uncharacterized protein LDX57_011621 [Aspergillus melleus]KAH8433985.1 hypothetical protein LDX57_011621 [Aspergillus melleus]
MIKCSEDALLLHCNETGFTKKNVDAICSAGQSSKISPTTERKFIGEKGIGFKSVFAVAQTVWISSNAYSFRFDGDKELGTIAPIWDENFPEGHESTGTSMYLRLLNSEVIWEVSRELSESGPLILLFLRKLRRIKFDKPVLKGERQRLVLERLKDRPLDGRTLDGSCFYSVVSDGVVEVTWLVVKHQVPLKLALDAVRGD